MDYGIARDDSDGKTKFMNYGRDGSGIEWREDQNSMIKLTPQDAEDYARRMNASVTAWVKEYKFRAIPLWSMSL